MVKQNKKKQNVAHGGQLRELFTGNERKQWIAVFCIAGALFFGLLVLWALGVGSKTDTESTPVIDEVTVGEESGIVNTMFEKTYDEYRAVINAELAKSGEYSKLSLSEFKEIGTDEKYKDYEYLKDNLYKATLTEDTNVYVVANNHSGKISQIRYSTNIENAPSNARLLGWLLGATMRLMYGDMSDNDLENLMSELSLEYPYEGMNTTYSYNQIIYRSILKNNIWTIYITDTVYSFIEEGQVAIVSYEEQAKINAEEAEKKRKAEEEAAAQLAAKERSFSAGKYAVGTDIDAGTYNIKAVSGRGNCFVRDSYGLSFVSEHFASKADDFYISEYKNVELSLGDTIEIHSSLKLKFSPVK